MIEAGADASRSLDLRLASEALGRFLRANNFHEVARIADELTDRLLGYAEVRGE